MRRIALVILVACGADPAPLPSAPVAVDVPPAPSASTGPLAQSPPPNPDRFHEPPAPTSVETPETPAPPPSGFIGGAPAFNRNAAAGGLSSVPIQRCAVPGGPTGMGHVVVTFDPNGTVSAVTIDQPPFAGTATGGCLARAFGTITVPPFSGAPVRIGKSFNLP